MSQTSLQSNDCTDEVHYAYESRKRFLKIVYQKKQPDMQGSMAMMLQSCDSVSFCHVDPANLPDTDPHWMRLFAGVFQGLTQRAAVGSLEQLGHESKEDLKLEGKSKSESKVEKAKVEEAKLADDLLLGELGELTDRGSFPTSDSEENEENLIAEQNERTKAQNSASSARSFSFLPKARSRKRVAFEQELAITIHPPVPPTPPTSILSAIIGRGSTSTPFTPARDEKSPETEHHRGGIPMELFSPISPPSLATYAALTSPVAAVSEEESEGLLSNHPQ